MPYRQYCALLSALCITKLDFVPAAGRYALHHFGDGRLAILSQTVDTAANEKMRSELFGQTVKLVNIALPIADMHASVRRPGQFSGLAQMIVPRGMV